ncbi:hypothetical protein LUX12_08005 [Streptomyces somaliensis]|uniref:hypothetical protein n=1 Tax=Streptomyces somaliensis TaxID=78355 RepID=UPI0020CD6B6B|nr:hypothetical protein [Streptomyces somaliensis]MCP9944735.1 hypothetical protein [Streptomyces somaliensis]MCP9962043.1 hypothetical protein [Streptomyces somaliensis]MCP9974861.1 hypothetical protein [Streptomyces somaliensis]
MGDDGEHREPRTDYACAGERHYDDASCLHGDGRLLNADHLFGLAVECLMKGLLLRFGAASGVSMVNKRGRPDKKPWWDDPDTGDRRPLGHWHEVRPALSLLLSGRSGPALAEVVARLSADFEQWVVDDRYTDGAHLDPSLMARRRESATLAFELQQHVQLTGKLP